MGTSPSHGTIVVIAPRFEHLDGSLYAEHPAVVTWLRNEPNGTVFIERQVTFGGRLPVDVVVAESGALALLDSNGGNRGSTVLTLLTSRGDVVRSYTLEELYTPERLDRFRGSVSSIDWRCGDERWTGDGTFRISDALGGRLYFDRNGVMTYATYPEGPCVVDSDFDIHARTSDDTRVAAALLALALVSMVALRSALRARR